MIWTSLDTCRNYDACWFGEFLFVWCFLNSNIICIDLIVSGSCLVPGFVLFLKPFFHGELTNADSDCCGYWVAHVEKWFGGGCCLVSCVFFFPKVKFC